MSHADDFDHLRAIVNQVHDPIVTHPNTIAVRSLELGGARWPRLSFERNQLLPDPPGDAQMAS